MRRSFLMLAIVAAALSVMPASAQSNAQLGPLCTSEGTPADKQIDACNKILALKVFSGEKLATIYFWRAVGYNKKGDYAKVIADTTEALRLKPDQALYNMRGSAYYDKGEDDIAVADFNDALRIGPPSGHSRGNAFRSKRDYPRVIKDYEEAIRLNPSLPSPLINRTVIWRAKGNFDRAIANATEAIGLARAKAPVNIMTPPGSVMISAYIHRALTS